MANVPLYEEINALTVEIATLAGRIMREAQLHVKLNARLDTRDDTESAEMSERALYARDRVNWWSAELSRLIEARKLLTQRQIENDKAAYEDVASYN